MASEDARKLFVAGLPDSITEEVLRGLFSESGTDVTELTLPRDRLSGRPRGFAFVRLGSQEDADRARQVLDGRIVDGKAISVRPFQAEPPPRGERGAGGGPRGERGGGGAMGNAPDRTLYVGNLPYDATQEEIETLLLECGAESVLRVHLPLDPEGRKRGFGFVTLGSADVARAAIDQLKGAELRGRRLIVNLAHPRGEPRPRSEGGNGAPERPPRSFGVVGGGGFAPPPPAFGPPALANGKADGRRKRRFEGAETGEGGRGGSRNRHDQDDRWRDQDDDE